MTGLASCYGRPDLAEARPMNLAELLAAAARCGTCPLRRECPPTPGHMCAGQVCVATEKNGMQEPYTVTVWEYARTHGKLPKRPRRRVQVAAGQLQLFRVRKPRGRKAVAA